MTPFTPDVLPPPASAALRATGQPVELPERQLRRLAGARGTTVVALRGQLWITVAGVPGDILLRAGERWTIPGDGLALLEAIGGDALACLLAGDSAPSAAANAGLAARMAARFAALRPAPCLHVRPLR